MNKIYLCQAFMHLWVHQSAAAYSIVLFFGGLPINVCQFLEGNSFPESPNVSNYFTREQTLVSALLYHS